MVGQVAALLANQLFVEQAKSDKVLQVVRTEQILHLFLFTHLVIVTWHDDRGVLGIRRSTLVVLQDVIVVEVELVWGGRGSVLSWVFSILVLSSVLLLHYVAINLVVEAEMAVWLLIFHYVI